ncbi:MAG: YCF48-related protein [Flavisolibacter sp.]
MLKASLFIIFFLSTMLKVVAQSPQPSVKILTSGAATSLRGLSVVSDELVWVSGSNGTVGMSSNGGKDWKWMVIKGFEKNDFRAIEAFDLSSAVVVSIGEPAYILKTTDGGETWRVVYENKSKGIFIDAMEFWNDQAGIVLGDPLNGKFFIARTFDGGNNWKAVPPNYLPIADSGEACFAASGTSLRALNRRQAVFVSGGAISHIFIKDARLALPIIQGKESTGASSIAVWDHHKINGGRNLVVVGGDYKIDSLTTKNCFYSLNAGKTWKAPLISPHGYRSCVEYLSKNHLVCCGLTGVDVSYDNANSWKLISSESFHVCKRSRNGSAVFLAGSGGKIGKIIIQ